MSEEGDFPKTDDGLAASTKRLADWTFSLQGVGADLKALMTEFKTYWRSLMPAMAMEGTAIAAGEPKVSGGGVTVRQGSNVNQTHFTEHSKLLPWLIFTSVLSGFSLATAIFVLIEFAQMQNNMARMAIHMTSNDALLLRERIIQPGDMWRGPEGNLEYGRGDRPLKK